MTDGQRIAPEVQKAMHFFAQANLLHLLELMREKYIEVGQVGGQVVLSESTPQQRRELASFLGKSPYTGETLKIRLRDMDSALQHSGFACTLIEVLQALTPDQLLETRKERRATQAVQQNAFHEALQALLTQVTSDTYAHQWLSQGQHGLEWLYTRSKNASTQEQAQQLQLVHFVMQALSQLPGENKPERLALFAQRISGNPHALDITTQAGRLFLLALQDLASITTQPVNSEEELSVAQTAPSRIQDMRLYARFGLLVDTISSNVAVYNVYKAVGYDNKSDALIEAARKRVLLLPLRQVQEWQQVTPTQRIIYIFENPQVFEEVVEQLSHHPHQSETPSLVCTSGWPSVAALMLLDLLLAQSPDNTLYYSGDFDLKGLQIAAYLLARYPGRCKLWQMDANAYEMALQNGGISAKVNELSLLDTLPDAFTALVKRMQEREMWAYQEGIVQILCDDVC